jgi:class 3 adenylate cyclase/pimeloyl-ACP methyl ester carboxylesterase
VHAGGYVESDGHHLAYQVRDGAGDRDVVVFTPGGTIPMDYLDRDRNGARLLEGLAALGRVVLFDRRGIGLSDPITEWSRPLVEQWADDLWTIATNVCATAPVVVSLGDYWGPARLFAAHHPDALSSLVLYEPTGPVVSVDLAGSARATEDWLARVCPSRAEDHAFREWFDAAGRTGASPGTALRIYDRPADDEVQKLVDGQRRITVPVLVLRRPGNLLGSAATPDPVAIEIPRAERVDLPGIDYHWLGDELDAMLAEISRFVTGESVLPAPVRELCAVLFTDLVSSTEQAAAVGDKRWKTMLDRHDEAIRREVAGHGGVVVKTTGDGALATFPSADAALVTAHAIRERLAGDDLSVRIGVHVGDVERRGTDVAGIGVHIAARVMASAEPDEVLVTVSVPVAASGTSHQFEPAGERSLKGLAGTWALFRAVAPQLPRSR